MDILCRDTLPSRAWRDKLSFSSSYAWREERRRVQCHRCVYNNTPQLTEQCTQPHTQQRMVNRPHGPSWVVLGAQWNLSIGALKSKVMLILSWVVVGVGGWVGGGTHMFECATANNRLLVLQLSGWPSVTHFAEATASLGLSSAFTSSHLCWYFSKESQSDPAL